MICDIVYVHVYLTISAIEIWLMNKLQIWFQVRDELEHLLDDDEDMTQLYLTRKWLQNQQSEALLGGAGSISFTNGSHHLRRLSSVKSGSMLTSANLNDDDVEDLEMLLEAYFMQLDGTRNKILSVSKFHPRCLNNSTIPC